MEDIIEYVVYYVSGELWIINVTGMDDEDWSISVDAISSI